MAERTGRVHPPVGETSKTKVSEQNSTDVNRIMAKYLKTGVIDHWNERRPVYGDVSQGVDYKEAYDLVMAADDAFMRLPASVRAAAENQPGKLMDMMASAEGMQELVDAGMELDDEKKPETAPEAPKQSKEAAAADGPPVPSEPTPPA